MKSMRCAPLAMVLLGGCAKPVPMPELAGLAPSVELERIQFDGADWQGVQATFVLSARNRAPISMMVPKLVWNVDVAGSQLFHGVTAPDQQLAANATSSLPVPVRLNFSEMLGVVRGAQGRETVPYTFRGEITVQTPGGPLNVPYTFDGFVPTLRAPTIKPTGLRVQSLDGRSSKATLVLDLQVTDAAGGAMTLDDVDWSLSFLGTAVADGKVASLGSVGPDGTATLALPIQLNLLKVGSAAMTALQKRQPLEVGLRADLAVKTPLGSLPLSIRETAEVPVR
jgi:LEA14-like dessication related protein